MAALVACSSLVWLLASHSPDMKHIKEDVMQAHDSLFEYLVRVHSMQHMLDVGSLLLRRFVALYPVRTCTHACLSFGLCSCGALSQKQKLSSLVGTSLCLLRTHVTVLVLLR